MKKKARGIMTAVIAVLVVTVGALLLFTDIFKAGSSTAGVLIDKDTGKETPYAMEIVKYDEIGVKKVTDWIEENKTAKTKDGVPIYYTLINQTDKDVFDMYYFMPLAQDVIGDVKMSDVRSSVASSTLSVYISTKKVKTHSVESTDLILHVFAQRDGETVTAEKGNLLIDGEKCAFGSASFVIIH